MPPQRKDWWAREIRAIGPLRDLPNEIFDLIIKSVDGFPMSWADALDIRNVFMRERRWMRDNFIDIWEGVRFSVSYPNFLPLRR